ncbi:inner membrane protein [Escherichia coli O157:H43 str. T22]|nr:inner membrane protein [Escherichia coli O157:H43 str. T22]
MGIIAQNKISSLGMLFGAIALMMGIIHFSFGPFSAPPPTFESIVADKTAEIKRGLLAGIKGEKITTVEKKEDVDVDKILDQSGIALAIAALLAHLLAVCVRKIAGAFAARWFLAAGRWLSIPCFLVSASCAAFC